MIIRGQKGNSNAPDGRYDSGKIFPFGLFEPPGATNHAQYLIRTAYTYF